MNSEKYRPTALDLNAPILSTRRPPQSSCCIRKASSRRGVSDGIPFSWEQAPGKPKKSTDEVAMGGGSPKEADTPRLRPPPQMVAKRKGYITDGSGDVSSLNNEEDAFSNAVDVFSLSEAMDILERAERSVHARDDNIDQLKLKIAESCGKDASPNFMINRFLPDASALALAAAASSALTSYHHHPYYSEDEAGDLDCCKRQVSSSCRYKEQGVVASRRSAAAAQASGAQKGCGMENLFLWRMKPRFCGDHKTCHVQPFSTAKPKNM